MHSAESPRLLVLLGWTRHSVRLIRGRRDRSSRPAARDARPVLEALERREVLSLTPVAANAGYPYTAIVELQATFPDHKTFVGTGALVDSFHVLTAGHVIYSAADGGFASQVLAIPELSGNSQPYGSAYATFERTYTTFINFNKAHPGQTGPGDYDIGLITLNRTIGNSTGYFAYGYDNNNADFAAGTIYNTAGYPAAGGYDGHHLEFSAGQIAGLSPDGTDLEYYQSQITTYGGQSGSPVWRYTPSTNSRVIYAVHIAGSGTANSLNFATRITQGIFNDLQNWRAADATPSASTQTAAAPVGNGAAVQVAHTTAVPAVGTSQATASLSPQGVGAQNVIAAVGPLAPPLDAPQGPFGAKSRPSGHLIGLL
jgi:V8-like Glu-specific endopeptidase